MSTSDSPSPTDLDLMLYADGELEGAELAAVEAWIQRDPAARTKLAALGLVSDLVSEESLRSRWGTPPNPRAAPDLTDAIMERIEKEASSAPRKPQPANDNARAFYVIAATVVAAAAAALLFWSRPADTPLSLGGTSHPPQGPVAHQASGPPEVIMGAAPHAGAVEAEVEHGVEVSSIDFGESTGAVFYVPNGTSPSDTTTVVWLEDSAGEEE